MSGRQRKTQFRIATVVIGLAISLVLVAILDQIALRSRFIRMGANLRARVQLTDHERPPAFELRRKLEIPYETWSTPPRHSTIRTNSLGFRDHERHLKHPDDSVRIVALEDSITFGLGIEGEEAFPAVLENELGERGFSNVSVRNAGTPGHSMIDHAATLRERLAQASPGIVVLQFCSNDDVVPFHPPAWLVSMAPCSALAQIYMGYRTTIGPTDPEAFLRALSDVLDTGLRSGAKMTIWIDGAPRNTHGQIEKIAAERGVEITRIEGAVRRLSKDDNHFSPEGIRQVVSLVLPSVMRLLKALNSAKAP